MTTIPKTMRAMLTLDHGGLDQLQYRTDVPTPVPQPGEVLIRVAAAGMNNTDINTRIGWYSKSVSADTAAGAAQGIADVNADDAAWNGRSLGFPIIQGADCCGHIVAVGAGVDPQRLGQRVITRTMQTDPDDPSPMACWTMGSECSGAFADYVAIRSSETFAVDCDWSDAALASLPCAYSTAEGMLDRAQVGAETVLITGASGGVGSAAIQLAKRRGARVIAVASAAKHADVMAFGADQVVDRKADLASTLAAESVDVAVDLVAGEGFKGLIQVLKRGGRYVASGAIGGPIVDLDVRDLYLKDLTLLGSTFQPMHVFENLVAYVERGEIRPLVAKTYPLKDMAQAQADFLEKKYAGKLVLIP